MASLTKTINFPSTISGARNDQFNGSKNTKNTMKMACMQASPLWTRQFSGLHCSNALKISLKPEFNFHSKMDSEIYSRRGKPTRDAPKARFEGYTEKAIKVIILSHDETKRLGHNVVGTEEILLGLINEGTGIGAKILKSMGINLKEARIATEKIIGRGSGISGIELPFSLRAKDVLRLAREEACFLGDNLVSSEHLLLALINECEGAAAPVLDSFNIDRKELATKVLQAIEDFKYSNGEVGADVGSDTPRVEEYRTNPTNLSKEWPRSSATDDVDGIYEKLRRLEVEMAKMRHQLTDIYYELLDKEDHQYFYFFYQVC